MMKKRSKGIIILTVVVIILSVLSASLGYGFMHECIQIKSQRFLYGIVFMSMTPLLVVLLIQLNRKK